MLKVMHTKSFKAIIFVATLALSALVSSNLTYADTFKTNIDVAPKLNVTVPSTPTEIFLDPGSNAFDYEDLQIEVSTNNYTGYYMTVSSDSTKLVKREDSSKYIETLPELTGGYSDYNFPNNKWGYKLGTEGNYIPFVSGTKIAESSTTANGEITNLRIATKIDFNQPSGTYEIELNFVAVANYVPTYIQNLDPALCTTDPMTVIDIRDNQEYLVQQLADGRCWMLDNLRLDPTEVSLETLKGNTNASDETLTYLKNGGGTGQYPASGVSSAWTSSSQNSYTLPYINTNYKDTVASTTYGEGSGKIGVFYNFCAVSAGSYCYGQYDSTGNADYDVCPSGWRLPTGDATKAAANEFKDLYLAYGSDPTAFKTALSTPFTGYFAGGTINNHNNKDSGEFWTSTWIAQYYIRILYVSASEITPDYNFTRYDGRAVRCVLDAQPASTAIEYLQDMTPTAADKLGIGDTITLKDKRDNEEYLVGKLADGNLWLLDNLRLDPTAVSLETLKGNTNATDQILTYFKNGGGSEPYPVTGVIARIADGTDWADPSYVTPYIVAQYKDDVTETTYGSGSSKIGVYYNYCAASAGSYCYSSNSSSGNAIYDVCPKGWRIPVSGATDDIANEYNNLYLAYDSDPTVFNDALSITTSGYFYNGATSFQNSYGFYWSSTFQSTSFMHGLFVASSFVDPSDHNARYYGYPVRCIFKNE